MCLMMNEMEMQLLNYVQQGEQISKEGVEILCNEDHVTQRESIIELHRTVFAHLYKKCGAGKDKYLSFQVEWHKYCSALLLPIDMGLQAVHLDKSPPKLKKTIEQTRMEWHQFCESVSKSIDLHMCSKIMVICSSILYNFFLEHMKNMQKSSREQPESTIVRNVDEDDVYYRFGGATISDMIKLRYKDIQRCPAINRDKVSQEITILLGINTKDKSEMPDYLKYRDRGHMYTPTPSFVPFLREVDTCVKSATNSDSFKQHGDEIIKVCFIVPKIKVMHVHV